MERIVAGVDGSDSARDPLRWAIDAAAGADEAGSVSQQAAHHAPCPVVIIPPAA